MSQPTIGLVPFPVIRLTLDSMKAQIVHAFTCKESDWKDFLDKSLDDVVKRFPFEQEVEKQIASVFQEALKRSIDSALFEAMRDEQVQTAICQSVRDTLRRAFQ